MARKTKTSKNVIAFAGWRPKPQKESIDELEKEPPGKTYRHLRLILKEPEEPLVAA
jgi:hypothetical protein